MSTPSFVIAPCVPAGRRRCRRRAAVRLSPFAGRRGSGSARRRNCADAFIRIDRTGAVTLIMPQVEMGQGVYTSISMILAEELDANWDNVKVEAAPPNDALYGNPTFKEQMTGNSNSIRAFWTPLRKAAAGTRATLIEAAAKRWKTDAASCRAENGQVVDATGTRRLGYGDLIDDAAQITPPADPPLKKVADFKLIGKPLKRLDTPDKVNGKAMYGIDAMPSGLKFATLAACPVFGGKVAHVDDTKAKQVPGVRQIVVLEDLVAVVGDHMWAAKQGLAALDITWDEGANAGVSSADVWAKIRAASGEGRTRRQDRRRSRQGPRARRARRRRVRNAVPRPRDDGTAELHRARAAGFMRSLVRLAGAVARAQGRRDGRGPPAREGHDPQSPDRRRIRPSARNGLCRQGRAHRPESRRPGQGRLYARRGHPPGHLSPGLSRRAVGEHRQWSHRRLEASHHGLVDHRALPARLVQDDQGDRRRYGRQRSRHAVRHSESAHRVPARRATGRADRFLARRRAEQQRVRDREFHR